MLNKLLSALIALFLITSLSGCVYKMDIQQGNVISQKQADRVKRGMSSQQVVAKLGQPILANPFAKGRMTYIYTMQHGHHRRHTRNFTVYFVRNRVTNTSFEKY